MMQPDTQSELVVSEVNFLSLSSICGHEITAVDLDRQVTNHKVTWRSKGLNLSKGGKNKFNHFYNVNN